MFEFSFVIEFDSMVSTNDAYFHVAYKKKGTNRLTTHAVKTQELKDFQSTCEEKFKELIPDDIIQELKDNFNPITQELQLTSMYYMPLSNYKNSDVSNYIKAYEDCISTRLKGSSRKKGSLDDKNINRHYSCKKFSNTNKWRVESTISVMPRDPNYLIMGD